MSSVAAHLRPSPTAALTAPSLYLPQAALVDYSHSFDYNVNAMIQGIFCVFSHGKLSLFSMFSILHKKIVVKSVVIISFLVMPFQLFL